MKKIVFTTHNNHKLDEVQKILKNKIEIIGLNSIGCSEDIPETAATMQENALLKAKYVFDKYGFACFADDTGLEVEVLNGAPGVYSARYAGEPANSENNVQKLLKEMNGNTNRKAQFRTVIALVEHDEEHYFEGIIKGEIAYTPKGKNGFGYDPVFIPEGYDVSFAQMDASIKNEISHRAIAINKLVEYLSTNRH